MLCDGVKVQANIGKRRSYQSSPVCVFGEVNPENHLRISWQLLPHYSIASKAIHSDTEHKAQVTAHYRMAATGVQSVSGGQAIFMAGSNNPYNYSGIGYNGVPSEPHNFQYTFDFKSMQWLTPSKLATPSMDHRGLICHNQQLLRIGGMLSQQNVSKQVLMSPLTSTQQCTQ